MVERRKSKYAPLHLCPFAPLLTCSVASVAPLLRCSFVPLLYALCSMPFTSPLHTALCPMKKTLHPYIGNRQPWQSFLHCLCNIASQGNISSSHFHLPSPLIFFSNLN